VRGHADGDHIDNRQKSAARDLARRWIVIVCRPMALIAPLQFRLKEHQYRPAFDALALVVGVAR
jgi:hypothetical protein